jgi:predicted transposase/invertase (TIGR01784 family)
MTPFAPRPVRYLDPKVDLAFKRIFGEHIDLLKSFLNALLPLPDDAPIDTLEYLTPEQVPELPYLEKYSIVDVKCQDTQGRIFIVEMQMMWSASFDKRIVFSGSQAYVKQLKKGQHYESLQPVYALALVNSLFEPDSPDYYHHYKIIKVGEPAKTLAGLEFVFIELPKFKAETHTDKRMTHLWLRFLNEIGKTTEQIPDPQLQNEADIARAMELMQVSAFTEDDLYAYQHSLDEWRSYKSLLTDSWAEGMEKGMAEGMEKGKAEGILAVAIAMKLKGLDSATIAEMTGLSEAVIRQL